MKKIFHMLAGLVVFLATPGMAQMKPVVEKESSERMLVVSINVADLCTTNKSACNAPGTTQWDMIIGKILSATADPVSPAGTCRPKNDNGRLLDERDHGMKFLSENCPALPGGRVIYVSRNFLLNH